MGWTLDRQFARKNRPRLMMARLQGPLTKVGSLYRKMNLAGATTVHPVAGSGKQTDSPEPALLKTWRKAPLATGLITGLMPLATEGSDERTASLRLVAPVSVSVNAEPLTRIRPATGVPLLS